MGFNKATIDLQDRRRSTYIRTESNYLTHMSLIRLQVTGIQSALWKEVLRARGCFLVEWILWLKLRQVFLEICSSP